MISLRRALLLTLLAAVAAVTVASALATYGVARRELDQVFDYHLRQIALSLREQVRASVPRPVIGGPGELDFAIQIWDADGNRVYASRPGVPLPEVDVLGFATVAAPGGAAIEVADTGPGIPAAERARVFDRFYRLPGTAAPGSGLGLAIVRAVAGRHGAVVELSDTPGVGLTVGVRFRAAPRPEEAPRP